MKAARRYLTKAISRNGKLGLINIDKSGSNKPVLTSSIKIIIGALRYGSVSILIILSSNIIGM